MLVVKVETNFKKGKKEAIQVIAVLEWTRKFSDFGLRFGRDNLYVSDSDRTRNKKCVAADRMQTRFLCPQFVVMCDARFI